MNENSLALKKQKADNIPEKNNMDTDYTDDLALLTNIPA